MKDMCFNNEDSGAISHPLIAIWVFQVTTTVLPGPPPRDAMHPQQQQKASLRAFCTVSYVPRNVYLEGTHARHNNISITSRWKRPRGSLYTSQRGGEGIQLSRQRLVQVIPPASTLRELDKDGFKIVYRPRDPYESAPSARLFETVLE